MSIFTQVKSVEHLMLAASLPDDAQKWLQQPLSRSDVRVTTIRKSGGGYRTVYEPRHDGIARAQKRLKEFLDTKVLAAHPCVHGFTRRRGAFSNAATHLGARAVLTVDIKDFFPSITRIQVEGSLSRAGAEPSIAGAIANITTMDGSLATGFSTSPVLSNLVFNPLDEVLQDFASGRRLTYSRYADDLSFSGDAVTDEELASIQGILSSGGYVLNSRKVRFLRAGHSQIVSGHVIAHSDHPRLPKAMKRRIRQDLYYVKKNGVKVQAEHRGVEVDKFIANLRGRIAYLMGAERELAQKFSAEFENLIPDLDGHQ